LKTILAGLAMFGALAASAFAGNGSPDPLYSATTIVTGEREETRFPGFVACFRDVLVRVSGDPRLASRPGLTGLEARARSFVWSYTYHDRYFGKPIADEQGTRDRPFDLTVQFDGNMIDTALASLGARPWPEPRPRLVIAVGVRNTARTYMLVSDADLGSLQREAFFDASDRYAVPIAFPDSASLAAAGIDYEALASSKPASFAELARSAKADLVLSGRLDWSEADLGWIGAWLLVADGREIRWQVRGVNFDAAFRNAIGGAARFLSGNGEPD
jgi:hypothetical protein